MEGWKIDKIYVLNIYVFEKFIYCFWFIFRKGGLIKDISVDLVLSCVDNFEVRMVINIVSIVGEIVMCIFVW